VADLTVGGGDGGGGDETLRRERDLYRALLELGCREEIDPFLEEALSLVVALTGARRASTTGRGKFSSA
jgi:hypothetical protein